MERPGERPPSVDALARSIAGSGLPHPILVDIARAAIADGDPDSAPTRADELRRTLLSPVVNATGVLLHTNLGRAPLAVAHPARPQTIEFDLATGERGSRQRAVGQLFAKLCGAEDAIVVNNNAAAVLLVLATLAAGRDVAVSRGESVEIGGAFRVPEVLEQSGARLVDVGTTNRTRLADYQRAIVRPGNDIAVVLKVHPSNYRVDGFVESTPISELAGLGVPLVADIGSGLIDADVPWLGGPPPAWLAGEPAAVQTLEAGADLVTFSGDKLLGGPQSGIIAGGRQLVAACAAHPLARALRCGGHVLAALQQVALAYLARTVASDIPFWRMAAQPVVELRERAEKIVAAAGIGAVTDTESVPGAGSAPGVTIPSCGVVLEGDHLVALRAQRTPIVARVREGRTFLDLRSVDPGDDEIVAGALTGLAR
ncbi:MAG TPA: L-seryl-tRNA(Sec) selenium transferase [Ilumatobacter sp.]|nr:L-seryl-tRNA(Sec) selenium transferase [Ilumatobacter sp.]